MDGVKFYTVKEIAKLLNSTQRTLYIYLKGGYLKGVKIGGNWIISEDNLREFLSKGAPTLKEIEEELKQK